MFNPLVIYAAVVLTIVITFMSVLFLPYFFMLYRFRSMNREAETRGWKLKLCVYSQKIAWLSARIDGVWMNIAPVYIIREHKFKTRSGVRFSAGCFYGDLTKLQYRLYGHYRYPQVIECYIEQLKLLGYEDVVKDWPKSYDDNAWEWAYKSYYSNGTATL